MVPEEVKHGVLQNENASMALGRGVVAPFFQVECEEPFNWVIRNNFLVLLHGGSCLNAQGYYGPHLRCHDKCPFSREWFQSFSEHRTTCKGEACLYSYCKESMDLYMHFRGCPSRSCKRCQAPIHSILNDFVQELLRKGKGYMLTQVNAQGHDYWRQLFLKNVHRWFPSV